MRKQNLLRVAWVRPAKLIWLPCALFVLAHALANGPPHFLSEYTWTGSRSSPRYESCAYVGRYPQRIPARDGTCPFVIFATSQGATP